MSGGENSGKREAPPIYPPDVRTMMLRIRSITVVLASLSSLLNAISVTSFLQINRYLPISALCESKIISCDRNNRRSVISSFLIGAAAITQKPTIANAEIRDQKTGILLPSPGEIEGAIPTHWDEDDNPFASSSSASFARLDSSPDTIFYSEPRFVEHVDEQAVELMTNYISDSLLQSGDSVLDLCSSWTSHVKPSTAQSLKRVAGLGMNAKELEANNVLTEWTVLDLNAKKDIKFPYEDASFDVVLCQLSIDYLVHPLEVMKEAARVLKPGGKIAILFSNRLFLSKAVGLWTGSDDIEHAYTVGSYLHYCKQGFVDIKAEDLSTRRQKGKERVIVGDPLYVVAATKS